jgi:hypothetical protein
VRETKKVYGITLYKCSELKNTFLTERGCLNYQNRVRRELLRNYPQIKYISKCITCKDGMERAKRLGFKLIDVSHILEKDV